MPRKPDTSARCLGPYKHYKGWQVTTLDPGAADQASRRTDRYFGTKEEAQEYKTLIEERLCRLDGKTIGTALNEYEVHRSIKNLKEKSTKETLRRLRIFFKDHDLRLARLTVDKSQTYYDAFAAKRSVDHHRNTLGEAKTFIRWCIRQKYLPSNPLETIVGIGRRNKGKTQLTGDEARKFHTKALEMAHHGDLGALGADMLLLMGLRQSEVFLRQVKDIDLGGTVLRIPKAKTAMGIRSMWIPDELQPLLLAATKGRPPTEHIFVQPNGKHHTIAWLRFAVERVCNAAGVTVVCPHGLRGTHVSLAIEEGQTSKAVAAAVGHRSETTTHEHYAAPDSVPKAQQRRALSVIQPASGRTNAS